MNKTLKFCLAAGLLTSLTYIAANADDPFGDDPFGSGPSIGNPFEDSDQDPFGGGSSGSSAETIQDDDPFADTEVRTRAQRAQVAQTDDPFGGPVTRPAKKVRPATPGRDDPFGADPFADRARRPDPRPAKTRPAAQARPATRQIGDKEASHARILEKLDELTTHSFIEIPLSDAVLDLSQYHDIPIVIDSRALEEIGLSAEEPISISLKNVTLRSYLRLMLRSLDLTYLIKDEVMQITTIEAAEQNLIVKIYKFPDDLVSESDALVSAINKTIVPDTWDLFGGPSSITSLKNVLIISTTSDVHDQVSDLLEDLEKKLGYKDE